MAKANVFKTICESRCGESGELQILIIIGDGEQIFIMVFEFIK